MKLILIVAVLLASVAFTASAADVLDLSTLGNNKPIIEAVSLPRLSPTMPTIAPTSLGGNFNKNVRDLSTLGNNAQIDATATMIKGSSPVTITPMFAIKNSNVTNQAGSVFTLPQAISASASVYTPPFAIFGGA